MEFYNDEIQKVLIAAALGAVIGVERELGGKPAGLRTLILVTIGAALFTIVSAHMAMLSTAKNSDITRIASNIVTGIGFIGAGIIFRGENNVHGLTTAATVWTAAAIGMAVGSGNYTLAIGTTVVTWAVLVVLHRVEYFLTKVSETIVYRVRFHSEHEKDDIDFDDYFKEKGYRLLESKYDKKKGDITVHWTVKASRKKHEEAIHLLLTDGRIHELQYG